jgi:23S rRNA (adenine2030-N6)-methyltransferase
MLSYRHAFHAGNHADVLKHTVLMQLLNYLTQKEKPLRVIDTHAGAGGYLLSSEQARKNREFDTGIAALWQRSDAPPAVADYLALVRSFAENADTRTSPRFYPGSPMLAQRLLREQDRLFLHELHPTDHRLLSETLGQDKRISISDSDGLKGVRALLPPPDRRGLVLIDPSYEIKNDYRLVVDALSAAHRRFATGTFALWYPVVHRVRIDELENSLIKSGIRRIQLFELGVMPDNHDSGMTASGMIVINPPWTLWQSMASCLPYLAECLGQDGQGHFRQVQLVPE